MNKLECFCSVIIIFSTISCLKNSAAFHEPLSTREAALNVIAQSDSMLISALPDVYNNYGSFNTLSDSFVVKSPDTVVRMAFSKNIRMFIREWQPEKGVFWGLTSEVEMANGCSATLAFASPTINFDTLMCIVIRREKLISSEIFDVTYPCDSYVTPVFERIPRFVYVNGKYERLGINTVNR